MIYLMLFCPLYVPIPIIVKVGFSHDLVNVFDRASDLTKAIKWGCFLPICIVAVPFAYRIEKWFHRRCKPVQVAVFKGSGSTETYPSPIALPVLAFMLFVWGLYFWAAGRAFGFDGLSWYRSFLIGLYLTFKQIYQFFA